MPGSIADRASHACVRCRYALDAPAPDALCPECGLPVAESLYRLELRGIARLRTVRWVSWTWSLAVVTWMVVLAVPMLRLKWLGFDGLGVSAWLVMAVMAVHALAQAVAVGACARVASSDPGRARLSVAAVGALLTPVAWGLVLFAVARSSRISQAEMLGVMLIDWVGAAIVVSAWMRMQREFRPDTSRAWPWFGRLAWVAVFALAVAVPLEWAGVPLSKGMAAPIRLASGMHLAAAMVSVAIGFRCARAVLPALERLRDARRAMMRDVERRFARIRRDGERAIAQLDAERIRRSLDGEVNSVAVIMKHLGGNLRSRFTDFLTTDGEKAWRDREGEFVDDLPPGAPGREAALAAWHEGWGVLESTLATLVDTDLRRTVRIRGETHTVADALARALAHAAYHQGQITLIARMLVGAAAWQPISIPRGGTAAHHAAMGFDPGRG